MLYYYVSRTQPCSVMWSFETIHLQTCVKAHATTFLVVTFHFIQDAHSNDGSHRILPVQSRSRRSDTHVCAAPEAQPLVCVGKPWSACGHLLRRSVRLDDFFALASFTGQNGSLLFLYVRPYFYLQATVIVLVRIFSFIKLSDR